MKVLIAHNRYRSNVPSGENKMVDAEIELLRAGGVEVVPFIRESDSISASRLTMAEAMVGPVFAPRGVRDFARVLNAARPDVVHLHNVFPLISPAVVRTAQAESVPVVQTVHNYRHSCVNGLHFRDGHVCVDCLQTRTNWPAVAHGCYRGSRLESVPMVLGQNVHRKTWARGVSTFIALTEFMRGMLETAGISKDAIAIRPTWAPDPGTTDPGSSEALFVGRLDENKGIDLLLRAWSKRSTSTISLLHVVGAGPSEAAVATAAAEDPSIKFHGPQPSAAVSKLMRRCGVLVVPSVWFEGYPLVIAEAFAHGRPVITLAGGSSASIVTEATGWTCAPNVDDLAGTLAAITGAELAVRGGQARAHYEQHNSPQAAMTQVMMIYRSAVEGTAG